MGILNETHNSRNQYFVKSITSAANAGQVTVGTVKVGKVAIEAVVLRSEGVTTADLTSAAITAGPSGAETTISLLPVNLSDGTPFAVTANINAVAEQISETWGSGIVLNKDELIVVDLQGTGATVVDLTVVVSFRSIDEGGGLS